MVMRTHKPHFALTAETLSTQQPSSRQPAARNPAPAARFPLVRLIALPGPARHCLIPRLPRPARFNLSYLSRTPSASFGSGWWWRGVKRNRLGWVGWVLPTSWLGAVWVQVGCAHPFIRQDSSKFGSYRRGGATTIGATVWYW